MTTHRMRDGREVAIAGMTDQHLLNTIAMLERKAAKGVLVQQGGGTTPEDFWYEEEVLYGNEALRALGYQAYLVEAIKRQLCGAGRNDKRCT